MLSIYITGIRAIGFAYGEKEPKKNLNTQYVNWTNLFNIILNQSGLKWAEENSIYSFSEAK